jgi:phospholipid N-methyltransferase
VKKKSTPRSRRSAGVFLRQAFDRSATVGGITPSSKALARKMVAGLSLDQDWVVELGPGTGVFTEELLAQGQPAARLVLIESNLAFASHLMQKFPAVKVLQGDARNLPDLLGSIGLARVNKIISGLPFRSFDVQLREDVANAIGRALAPKGVLQQFTYATKPPLPVEAARKAGLVGKRVELVLANVPPAFIWQYVKMSKFD